MILQHVSTGEKIVVSRRSKLRIELLSNGYRDITPVRTPKQIAQSKRFMAMGTLSRTIANLSISAQLQTFSETDYRKLAEARNVLEARLNKLRKGG